MTMFLVLSLLMLALATLLGFVQRWEDTALLLATSLIFAIYGVATAIKERE